MKKIWIHSLSLLSSLLFVLPVQAEVLKAPWCLQLFLKQTPRTEPAQILSFQEKMPEKQDPESFLSEMTSSGAEYFYSSSGFKPPLSKHDPGAWAALPYLNEGRDIFILKAYPKSVNLFGDPSPQVIKIEDLRHSHRLESYTQLTVTPIFFLLYKTIYWTRTVQSHLHSMTYVPASMDHSQAVQNGPLFQRLINFVQSWQTRTTEEQMVQELLLELIERHYKAPQENALERLNQELSNEFIYLYPPELSYPSFL